MAKPKKSFLETLTWIDWVLTLAAVGAIGYGLYRAYDLEPDDWSFVAGPLFALSSGFLFVLALRVQLREHRHAIEEMEQSNVNHSQILQVARHEKEFAICLQAVQHARQTLEAFTYQNRTGTDAISEVLGTWDFRVRYPEFLIQDHDGPELFSHMRNTDEVFPRFIELDVLNVYIYWTLHAVNRKDLAFDDRRYLNSLISPLVMNLGRAQHLLASVIQQMEEVLVSDSELLQRYSIMPEVMNYHLNAMKKLYDRREYKEEQLSNGT